MEEIYGFTHDFCNLKVRKSKQKFTAFAHNLFSTDFYFVVKRVRQSVWDTKDLVLVGRILEI